MLVVFCRGLMAQQPPVCMNDSTRAPIINLIKGTCLPNLMDQLQANITANKPVLARDVMFAALGTLERNLSVTQAENYINMVSLSMIPTPESYPGPSTPPLSQTRMLMSFVLRSLAPFCTSTGAS
jgi:hypothetical protein